MMMTLSVVAGMTVPRPTEASHLPAGWPGGSRGVSVPRAACGRPRERVLSKLAHFPLAAVPLAEASLVLKARFCAGGDHPRVWSWGDMDRLGPFLQQCVTLVSVCACVCVCYCDCY